jgi:alkanesulfonate monooxygenase SsuD/methylene tetrahydromethanopterin reductase-like flavin-dependent oxidoreductase (luciferase family)
LADHLLYRTPGQPTRGIWECWTILAALAEATHRVELGTLVLAMSFRNPAILAKMATALDEVSGGRLVLGVGAGWNEPEYQAFGLPFDHRVDRFEEALQILKPLLREGRVDFDGHYHQAP